jgi:iron complex outermembrane recepter protein
MVPIPRKSIAVHGLPFGTAFIYCLLVTNVVAADVPATNTEGASVGLEEIVVTAQRREESISRVPISLTAISQRTIDDLHLQSFADLESVVPGLVIATPTAFNPNLSDLAIRGVFSGGNAPTVQVYIDETPISIHALGISGISASPSPDLFDLDRVEVLRGPQGTLFGSSTMGGAIRFLTPQPSLNSVSGYSKAEMSSTQGGENSYALGIAYGAPIVEGLAGFRMSALYHTQGGYVDQENPYTGALIGTNINTQKSYVFRPALTIEPLEGLSFTLSAFVQHTDIANPAAYWRTSLPNPEPNGHDATGSTQQQPTIDDMSVSALTIKYELPAVSIQSNTSYLYRKYFNALDMSHPDSYLLTGNNFLPGSGSFPGFFWNDIDWTNTLQQEFRFSSKDAPGDRFHWVGGLYYRSATQTVSQILPGTLDPITLAAFGKTSLQFFGLPNFVDSTGQIDNGFTVFRNIDKEKAVFGEVSYDITSQLKATVGIRVSQDTISSTQLIAGPLDNSNINYKVLPSASESPITPRYALAYQINDQDMVYVSVAKGYRSGGTQVVDWLTFPGCQPSLKALGGVKPPVSFQSDTLWSYELGTKSTLFDRKLQVQASVYYVNWSNIQTQLQVPSCAEAFTTNFGQAISRGFDLQLAALATEHLTVGANVGYTDAYYPKDEISSVVNGVPNLLAQKGEKLPNIPPWSAAVNAIYRRPLPQWSGASGYFRVDYRFISAIPSLDPALSNYDPMIGPHQDQSYGMMNLHLGITHSGLDVSLFVNNVTKANPVVGYLHIAPGDPLIQASQIRPLTIGLTALYHIQ